MFEFLSGLIKSFVFHANHLFALQYFESFFDEGMFGVFAFTSIGLLLDSFFRFLALTISGFSVFISVAVFGVFLIF